MALPPLHVITDDEVLAQPRFVDRATTLLEAHGSSLALHLRGPRTPIRQLLRLAGRLGPVARAVGALFLVNDRTDLALAVDADGVQLGQRSLTAAAARRLRGGWVIGVSVHGSDEAEAAGSEADYLLLGTIWESASHPDRPGTGLGLVRDVHRRGAPPIVAIGGVTPERAASAGAAGAAGVAVLSGVWSVDPAAAAGEYLAAFGTAAREQGGA
jgi:thiamine-phosphate diphosphorylase